MIDAIRTGSSVLRYRGGEGQWAWAIHRVAGLGIVAFLALHIFDIFLAAFGPGLFNELLFLYKGLAARIGEILLAFGLIYHAINGLRIILADFYPSLAALKTARTLFWLEVVVFLAIFIPASMTMMYTLPPDQLGGNMTAAVVVTAIILAIPLVIAVAASFTPASLETGIDSDESIGNYADSYKRILLGTQRRPMDRFEINVWLFMRISGALLIIFALVHMFILHFVISVEAITFQTIVQRWQATGFEGFFWRTYDLILLALAFTHGILGARYVIQDYFHTPGWRRLLLFAAGALWVLLILMGAYIIFFFNGAAA
ncbi:MAG: succinate dehydrogenase, cytochrome b556 subunit [Rudaea sp.]